MTDPTAVLLIVSAIALAGVIVGGIIALAAVLIFDRHHDQSGLGDEDVAQILGYPMYPVWQARKNGGDRPEEDLAS